jgi:hypothetical protein
LDPNLCSGLPQDAKKDNSVEKDLPHPLIFRRQGEPESKGSARRQTHPSSPLNQTHVASVAVYNNISEFKCKSVTDDKPFGTELPNKCIKGITRTNWSVVSKEVLYIPVFCIVSNKYQEGCLTTTLDKMRSPYETGKYPEPHNRNLMLQMQSVTTIVTIAAVTTK